MTLQTNLLKGKLVHLTAQTKDDQKRFVEWSGNPDYSRLLVPEVWQPLILEDQETWFLEDQKNQRDVPFSIRTHDDEHIGFIRALDVNWQARHCDVGIGIGNSRYWGKGYGTDAMQVFLRYAFMEMNMNRVGLSVFSYNVRAIKSYDKLGFTHEGKTRQTMQRDDQFHDKHIMSILRSEWETLHK